MTRERSDIARSLLANDLMNAPAIVAAETATIREVARLMLTAGVSAVPIVDAAGKPVGMASDGDLVGRRADDERRAWWLALVAGSAGPEGKTEPDGERAVSEIMTAPLISIGPHSSAQEIAELLLTHRIKRLPVIENGEVRGVVSRTDLLPVVESIPKLHGGPDTGSGLLAFLESMIGGASLLGVDRPARQAAPAADEAASAAPTPQQPTFSAAAFRDSMHASKREDVDRDEQARRETQLNRRRQIKAMLEQHVGEQLWRETLDHAAVAARAGEKEFLLLRFPSDLCTDGGRKIDVAEQGWEETLRGEAAEVYDRWKKELKPEGFGLSASIVSYEDGVIGDIGLFLTWGE